MERYRCFISVDIENERVLDQIARIQSALLQTRADLKLVNLSNIHVTLRFLGDVDASMVDLIHEEMKKVSFSPFELELKGMGAFPSLSRMNVIWVGVGSGLNELRNIFDMLEPGIRKLGFPPDRKGFSPHITIARVRSGRKKDELAGLIMRESNIEFGRITVNHVRLKRSILTPKGPIYSTLREVVV
jgi:2'-5' RNA ligase